MGRLLIISLAVTVAWSSPAAAGWFSSTGPVIAIYAGKLFQGEAEGNLDGSGTIDIQSNTLPKVTCSGEFTSSAELGGTGNLECSDSSTVTIQFQRLSMLRGYGTGSSSLGAMSFTYGLSAIESELYLTLPPGKALIQDGEDLVLVDVKQPVPEILPVKGTISRDYKPRGKK
jgi:hypothetical protein